MYIIRCDKDVWIRVSEFECNGDIIVAPEQTLEILMATRFNTIEDAKNTISRIDKGYGTDAYIIEEVKNE